MVSFYLLPFPKGDSLQVKLGCSLFPNISFQAPPPSFNFQQTFLSLSFFFNPLFLMSPSFIMNTEAVKLLN